jgi:hypothetical protein
VARRRWLAALIGVVAGAVAFGGYVGATYAGIHISPEIIEMAGAALAFAAAVAVFSLLVMDKPVVGGAKSPIWLNEQPATREIFFFKGEESTAMDITPEMSLAQIMARYQDVLSPLEGKPKKAITLTLKASAKDRGFSTVTLQQLFQLLKPLTLTHVLLVSRKGNFVGYIPGKRAITEFASDKSDEKIGKYIVKLLEASDADSARRSDIRQNPDGSATEKEIPDRTLILREIGGSAGLDTLAETDDSRHGEAKIWKDESVHGFVIHSHLKPIGYISKADLIKLNVRWS